MHFAALAFTIIPLLASEAVAAPTITDTQFQQIALDTHNNDRARHGVPPLQWDDSLAAFAQQWADDCSFAHSNGPYGENIHGVWTSAPLDYLGRTRTGIRNGWYDEIALYDFNRPGFSAATGHFTQVVWRDTQKVGCAWNAKSCFSNGRPFYKLVCEYDLPGNRVGANGWFFVQNVPRPADGIGAAKRTARDADEETEQVQNVEPTMVLEDDENADSEE